jgi:replicative DNA helicase
MADSENFLDDKLSIGHNVENEQRIISYLMRNPHDVISLTEDYFLHNTTKAIYRGLKVLKEKELKFDHDTLLTLIKENSPVKVEFNQLTELYDSFTSFENIEFAKKELKSDWIKFVQSKKMIYELASKLTDRGYIDPKEIRKNAENLIKMTNEIDDTKGVLTTKELSNIHREDFEKRKSGEKIRTTGISEIDRICIKPLNEGEIYILFGEKGSGKSALAKNIENAIINRGICCISFNPEMPLVSIMDRIICMRGNFTMRDLHSKTYDRRTLARVMKVWEEFESIPNFLYSDQASFDFDYVEREIDRGREIFRKAGVLPSDGYTVVDIDLLSMAKDFGDKSPLEIEKGMDKLHRMTRRTGVSTIGVVQSNENKFRSRILKKPEDLDFHKIGLEDLKGSAAYAERARVVISITRPIFLKQRFFPEMNHIWELEPDLMHLHVLKNNDGGLGYTKLLFEKENFRVLPYIEPAPI